MTRKYTVYINEEARQIDVYKMWEPKPTRKVSYELGDEPGKRVEAVGFLAGVMELLPLSKTMPDKVEQGN